MNATYTVKRPSSTKTLTYIKELKGSKREYGLLYIHHFGTGWQELVFQSHQQAEQFALAANCAFVTTKENQ